MKMKIKKVMCKRCGHEWVPRQSEIRTCPKCKSPYWDRKRKRKKLSEETKKKIGEKSRNISDETRNKMRKSQTGRKHSIETIEKIRSSLTGKTRPEEVKRKVSEGLKRYFSQKKGGDV